MGIVQLPPDLRLEAISKLIDANRLAEVFSDFIGLMMQKDNAAEQFVDDFLAWIEKKFDPREGEKVNLPTVFGALHGVTIARAPVPGMCATCAYRQGTPANMSPITSVDAKWANDCNETFYCHHALDADGTPTRVCAGSGKSVENL